MHQFVHFVVRKRNEIYQLLGLLQLGRFVLGCFTVRKLSRSLFLHIAQYSFITKFCDL